MLRTMRIMQQSQTPWANVYDIVAETGRHVAFVYRLGTNPLLSQPVSPCQCKTLVCSDPVDDYELPPRSEPTTPACFEGGR